MNVIFVLGGPGAGKGTQCEFITETFDFVHLSAGDLLREERNNAKSEFGELISNYIKEGKIVPVEITVKLLLNAMVASGRTNFLVDGFPRNQDNLQGWETVVGDKATVLGCLFFDCPEEVMEKRLLKRGESSGRSDDNLESIRKRFRTYQDDTMPIINHFKSQAKCWTINSDRTMAEIRAEVTSVVQGELGFQVEGALSKVAHRAQDVAHAANEAAHKAAEAANVAAHKAADQIATLPPGVKMAAGLGFLSIAAFMIVRSLKN